MNEYKKRTLLGFIMKRLTIILAAILINSCIALADTWDPIIGIPEPPFGVTTDHNTLYGPYSGATYDYSDDDLGPVPYRIGPDGPYTHYIDPNDPNATDINNPNGTVDKPRKTRPNNISGRLIYGDPLPAGSVVEMHGTQGGVGPINISGTADRPIFLRGVRSDRPVLSGGFFLSGCSNIIFENIEFDMNQSNNPMLLLGHLDSGPISNIAVRHCEFYNGEYDPSESYQVIRMRYAYNNANIIQNIVIYNNIFHHIGDGRTTSVKRDAIGISIDANVRKVWIIGNTFHHIGGDAIQIAWDKFQKSTQMPEYIYIGGNTAHDCYENFLCLKTCQDVIVSQNRAYNFGAGYSEVGGTTSIPFRYGSHAGPDNVARNNIWTLFNIAYNSSSSDGAFYSASQRDESPADEIYYIGNIAYNCHNDDGKALAFFHNFQNKIFWLNNTAYNVDRGGYFLGDLDNTRSSEKMTVVNNIFSKLRMNSSLPYIIQIDGTPASFRRAKFSNNIFFDTNPVKFRIGVRDPDVSYSTYNSYNDFCDFYPSFCINSIETDPRFLNPDDGNFHLSSGSDAIGNGILNEAYTTFENRYGINITKDFDKNNRPVGDWDIGAYEYIGSTELSAPINFNATKIK